MKYFNHLLLSFAFILSAIALNAQNAPAGINYQAVLRDQQGQIIADQQIKVRVSVNDPVGRSTFYTETHTVTTNNVGILSLIVGGGKAEKGTFKDIPWSTANTWLEVAYDTDNNGSYEITGTTRMLSVPYAFYAEKAGSAASSTGPNPTGTEGGDGSLGQEAWMLKGNDEVDENLMWLGTRNYADLVVKTHDIERMRITKGIGAEPHDALIILHENTIAEKSMTIGNDLEVRGHTLLDDELMVVGNTYLKANLDVDGNVTVDKVLYVKGNVNADGDVVFNKNLTVLDDASVWGDAKVDGNMFVHHSLFVDIDGSFGHNLHVGNDADIDHNLNVDNDAHIGRDLDVDRNANVDVNLHVGNDADIDHNLNVDNDEHIGRDLDVDRNVNIDNNLTVQKDAFIKGNLDVDGTGTFFDLHVERDLDVDRNLNVDKDAHVGQDLDVDRNLNVDKSVTIHDNLTIDDNATVGGTLGVTGTLNANCRLVVNSCVSGTDDNSANYPVHIKGGNQGVYVEVTGGRSGANNFVTFADATAIRGRVEGQTLDELHGSFEYIWAHACSAVDLALKIAMVAACAAQADVGEVVVWGLEGAAMITKWVEWAVNLENKIGVAYESGSGDYAEWLERANPSDNLHYAEIVGVRGGKISHRTDGADHCMVISKAPIVLGNMPEAGREKNFEKVAFMGQVPVRVMGKVAVGDYILPSGNNDGYGKAVSPAKMRTEDFDRIVGVAWQSGEAFPMNIVNVAVGINTNDVAARLAQQERELADVKGQVNQLFTLLGQKAPYEGLVPASANAGVLDTTAVDKSAFAKATADKADKAGELDMNKVFEDSRVQIEALFAQYRTQFESQGIDINRFPEIAVIYNSPVEWMKDQYSKGYLDEMIEKIKVPSRN